MSLSLLISWLACLAAQDGPILHVPDGFVVEKIAAPPLVERPIMACFDRQGRLYVGDSAGVNLKFEELQKTPPHRMLRLSDPDSEGRFTKSVVFADRLTFPMGALWYEGSLYVCAPPSVWKLTDTQGAGVADRRAELVTKFGSSGNGADIHGPFLGPDGWFYWTDGRHGHSIDLPNGSRMQGNAARIFRCRPDGSQVEMVCGGGMDNPVEIAFTEEGEPLTTCALFQASPKRVDVIFHAIEGGVFPYHECVREFKRTGDLLPSVVDLGWVAPSGLMRYRGAAFGKEFEDNFFSAQFNTHRVQRHVIERDGATFRGRNLDFLTSEDPDFHPTDVLEDADGSLIVIDTGGWFRIGCPTSRIDKPQIKGAIYRVRKAGARRGPDPRAALADPSDLGALVRGLDDPQPEVRDQAIEDLAGWIRNPAAGRDSGGSSRPNPYPTLTDVLKKDAPSRTRRNLLWALARVNTAESKALVRLGLSDKEATVRTAAAHVAGLEKDPEAQKDLVRLLGDPALHVRREAATALGRLGDRTAVGPLLDAVRAGGDRFLEHSLLYALIRIDDREGTLAGLSDTSPLVRRAALIALDQMDHGGLTRELVTPHLDPSYLPLQQAALAILTARGWSGELQGLLRQWLAADVPNPELGTILVAFSKDASIQDLVARALRNPKTSVETRLVLLESMSRAPLDHLPATWTAELRWCLEAPEERLVRQSIAGIRGAGVADFDAALMGIARDSARNEELRVNALLAAAPRLSMLEPALFDFLVSELDREKPPLLRLAAAQALGSMDLTNGQLLRLAPALGAAGALEMPKLLSAYERSDSAKVGKELISRLEHSSAAEALPGDALRRTLKSYPEEIRQLAAPLLKRLELDLEAQKSRLAELAPLLSGGDAAHGREVFFGKKVACSTCHTVQAQGGRVGPDLSKIASIRTGRDLLESVVFPSASFARGYEPYLIRTRDGAVLDGLISRETAEAIYLYTADRTEKRVPRASIEVLQMGKTSIMPQGLDAQLSREELRDLLSFLLSLK